MAAFSTIALATLTAAQGASTFFGQRKAADATQAQGNYEARLFEQNAGVADLQAADSIARGTLAEQKLRGETRQTVGGQRVGLAAQGIDINSGSAADVQAEAQSIGETDALTTRLNAAREAWGFQTQAQDLRNRAELTRRGASAQAGALRTAATGTLLTTASSLYGQSRSWSSGGGASSRSIDSATSVGRRFANSQGGY